MAQLDNNPDVNWQQVQEIHDSWDYESQGLTGPAAALVAIAVAIATQGIGAGLVSANAGTVTAAAANAGFTSLASQASISLINNQGNIGSVLKELGSSDSIKGLATAMLTAGFQANAGIQFAGGQSVLGNVKQVVVNAGIKAGVNTAINGGSLGDNLKDSLIAGVVDLAGQELTQQIGDTETAGLTEAGDLTKTLAHAAVGCATAAAKGGDCTSGAAGAAIAEQLSPHLSDATEDKVSSELTVALTAGTAALLTGGDVNSAADSALQTEKFNRQLHIREIEAIKQHAKEFAEQEGIPESEAAKRMGRLLLSLTDASWAETFSNEANDPKALAALAVALAPHSDLYQPTSQQSQGDAPAITNSVDATEQQIKQWLTNYKENHTASYNNRLQNGEYLANKNPLNRNRDYSQDQQSRQFYEQHLTVGSETNTPYEQGANERTAGLAVGMADQVVESVKETVEFANQLINNTGDTVKSISQAPVKLVGELTNGEIDNQEIENALNELQGRDYDVGVSAGKEAVETLELVGGGVSKVAKAGKAVDVPIIDDKPVGSTGDSIDVVKGNVGQGSATGTVQGQNIVPNAGFGKYHTKIDDKVTVVQKNESVPDWMQESFLDSNYRTVVTNEEITVYRVFGGSADVQGAFVTTTPALNKIQAKIDAALLPEWKNTRAYEAEILIPKGTKLDIGRVAPQTIKSTGTVLNGLTDQLLMPQNWPREWVQNVRKVKP